MAMTISTQVTQMSPQFVDGNMVLGSVTVVVNFQSPQNYFGGQVVLTNTDDGISFTTTQDELRDLAIAKAKAMISATESPVSSADDSVASLEATVASSSVETSVSSASAQVTTTSSESTTEE